MTFIGFLSLALLLAVATWAAMVLARAADWRIRGLAGLLGLVTLANVLPFVSAMETWGFRSDGPGDLSDLFSGLVAFVAVVLLDRILRRNQLLERRLGSHLESFERLFETVGEAMLLLDREGRVLKANRTFHGMFGLRPDEGEGKGTWEVIASPEFEEEAKEICRRVVAGEQLNRSTLRTRADGTPLDVTLLAGPVNLPD